MTWPSALPIVDRKDMEESGGFDDKFLLCEHRNYLTTAIHNNEFSDHRVGCGGLAGIEFEVLTPRSERAKDWLEREYQDVCYSKVRFSGHVKFKNGGYANISIGLIPTHWNGQPHCLSAYLGTQNTYRGEKAIESILALFRTLKMI